MLELLQSFDDLCFYLVSTLGSSHRVQSRLEYSDLGGSHLTLYNLVRYMYICVSGFITPQLPVENLLICLVHFSMCGVVNVVVVAY